MFPTLESHFPRRVQRLGIVCTHLLGFFFICLSTSLEFFLFLHRCKRCSTEWRGNQFWSGHRVEHHVGSSILVWLQTTQRIEQPLTMEGRTAMHLPCGRELRQALRFRSVRLLWTGQIGIWTFQYSLFIPTCYCTNVRKIMSFNIFVNNFKKLFLLFDVRKIVKIK